MKILLSLLLCLSVNASNDTFIDYLVKPHERSVFKERLRLFELLPHQRKRRRDSRTRPNQDPIQIISGLNQNLQSDYLNSAQDKLGECSMGDCLSQDLQGAWSLKDSNDNRHCYPGTNCEYYGCMENKFRCLDVGVEYFANLAKPTCEAYVKNIKAGKFSDKGIEWIYTVMVCLQKGLFEECSIRGNCPESESNEKTCHHITEYTLKFHPGCYINSGVGVCKLPLRDQINIWRTVGPFLTKREREEAFKVVRYCLFKIPIE